MKIPISNYTVAASSLDGEIYLYRFGKDPRLALEKRLAEACVMDAFVNHMLHDMPAGSVKVVTIRGKKYEVGAKPATETELSL